MNISAVIIAKNEAHIIGVTLQSLQGIADDIVVVDSGSTDSTVEICRGFNAHVIEMGWEGYGINKNRGIDAAKHDWILNVDADEAIDEQLKQSLLQLPLQDDREVFNMRFKNFFCNKWIRFGEWGFDSHIRMFNRKTVRWNDAAVHEELIFPVNVKVTTLKGNILHYTVNNLEDYIGKTRHYAMMNAKKYFENGKKPNFFRLYFSPVFAFLQHYIFRLGFLDGREGFIIARTTAWYTFLKYQYLRQMKKGQLSARSL